MTDEKVKKIRKKSAVIAIICVVVLAIPILAMLKNLIIGPRYINDSALLNEQVIYYKFNNYHYVSGGSDVKSDRCIKRGLFEHLYLSEDGDYIISSQLHERYIFKREDLIEHIYKLYRDDNEITYHNDGNGEYLDINGEKYLLLDKSGRGSAEFYYDLYVSCGTVDFYSNELEVYMLKDDYQGDFVLMFDSDTFMDYIFTKADVDMNAYNTLDSNLITAYNLHGTVNHKSFGNIKDNDEKVVNALKELKSSDAPPIGDIFDCRPSGNYLYFDLIYSDLPILHKDRLNIIIDDNNDVYYLSDDSPEIYMVSDEDTKNVFITLIEQYY